MGLKLKNSFTFNFRCVILLNSYNRRDLNSSCILFNIKSTMVSNYSFKVYKINYNSINLRNRGWTIAANIAEVLRTNPQTCQHKLSSL